MEEDIHAGEMEPAIEEERQAVYLPSPLLISPQVFHSKLESHLFKNSFHNLSFASKLSSLAPNDKSSQLG